MAAKGTVRDMMKKLEADGWVIVTMSGSHRQYRHPVIIGICRGGENYGATALDYPGCVAVGKTIEEVKDRMREALAMHIEGMLEDGEELPEDVTDFAVLDVQVQVPEAMGS